jgi:cytoskeleton protein RodZ
MKNMKNDNESLSFGRYLQAIRLERKVSLEQVAAQTRIGLGNLLLIEQEDHEQLPAVVFVKGFLRSYAAAIGADGDEAIRRYELRLGVVQKIAESEAPTGKTDTRLWWKLLISLSLLLGIIAVSILVISFLSHTPGIEESPQPISSAAEEKSVAGQAQEGVKLSPDSANSIPQKLSLRITALENTWAKVIIDEKESTEYNLSPGDDIELEATTGYNLLIGNAGGIKIALNGKAVSIPGESGQVVTMHLP